MTERNRGYIVALDDSERVDSADVLNAIRQLKGVVSVEQIRGDVDQQLAKQRAKQELVDELWGVLASDHET